MDSQELQQGTLSTDIGHDNCRAKYSEWTFGYPNPKSVLTPCYQNYYHNPYSSEPTSNC